MKLIVARLSPPLGCMQDGQCKMVSWWWANLNHGSATTKNPSKSKRCRAKQMLRVSSVAGPVLLLAIFSSVRLADARTCAECLAATPPKDPKSAGSFCGTDHVTYHNASADNVKNCEHNELVCGVLYAGTCECPNNCTSGLHGSCSGSGGCVCNAGWTGPDCMTVSCPTNDCSGNGVCDTATNMCHCKAGYGGVNCDVNSPKYSDLPWGCAVPPVSVVEGGCTQPIRQMKWWDWEGIPQLRFTLSDANLTSMLDPKNYKSDSKADVEYLANFTFISTAQNRSEKLENIHIHIKGAMSKYHPLKTFKVSFKNSVGGKDWQKHMTLKSTAHLVGGQFISTYLQTIGVPTLRTSFVLVYFNDNLWSLYQAYGDFSSGWMDYWYGVNASMNGIVQTSELKPFNYDPGTNTCIPNLDPTADKAQKERYCLVADLAYHATQADFDRQVFSLADVDTLVRAVAVSQFMLMGDSMVAGGHNYEYYDSVIGPKWSVSLHDFDAVYAEPTATEIKRWFAGPMSGPVWQFGARLYNNSVAMTMFVDRYQALIKASNASGTPTPGQFYISFLPFLAPYMEMSMPMFVLTSSHNANYKKEIPDKASWMDNVQVPNVAHQLKNW